MDVRSELVRERATLVTSGRDLWQGEARVAAQASLVSRLAGGGHDFWEAERLLRLLGETLAQWRQHHALILERIAYLESKLSAVEVESDRPAAASAPAAPPRR